MEYYEAIELINLVGGEDNIIFVGDCSSRVRLVLKDDSLIDFLGIKKLTYAIGVFKDKDELHVIYGFLRCNTISLKICEILEKYKLSTVNYEYEKDVRNFNSIYILIVLGIFILGIILGLL